MCFFVFDFFGNLFCVFVLLLCCVLCMFGVGVCRLCFEFGGWLFVLFGFVVFCCFVCLFCLFACLFVCLFVWLFVCVCLCVFVYVCV